MARTLVKIVSRVALVAMIGATSALAWTSVAAAGVGPLTKPAVPPTVIVYGDSLLAQSRLQVAWQITAARPGSRVLVRAFPGTALCDALPQMREDGDENAQLVVVEFSGNAFQTPGSCMLGRATTPDDVRASYTADAETAAALWAARHVPVVFVAAPMWETPPGEVATVHPLDEVYRAVANTWAAAGDTFTTATEFVLSAPAPGDKGAWVFPHDLPCLASERGLPDCRGGEIDVRAPDKAHFCPVNPGAGPCEVYSSGVVRFGGAIAQAALDRLT